MLIAFLITFHNFYLMRKKINLVFAILFLAMLQLQAQTRSMVFHTAPASSEVLVDGVPFEAYKAKLAEFVSRFELTSTDGTLNTYTVDFSYYSIEGEKLKSFQEGVSDPAIYSVVISADQKKLLVAIDTAKSSTEDLAHSLLWLRGIRE